MVKRQKWSEYEDKILTKIIQTYKSEKNWEEIINKLSPLKIKKSIKQCKERWNHHLNPNLNKKKWKIEENKKLFKLHYKFGNKWKIISEYFPGRTDNIIKNQFFSLVRKSLRISRKYLGKNSNTNLINKIKPKALSQFINNVITVDIPGEQGQVGVKKKILINEFLQKFAFYNFKDICGKLKNEDSFIIVECLKLMMKINRNYEKKKKLESFENVKKKKKIRKMNKKNKILLINLNLKKEINFMEEFSKLIKEKDEYDNQNKILLNCGEFNPDNKKKILENFIDLKNNISNIIETLKLTSVKDYENYYKSKNILNRKNSLSKMESENISKQNKEFFRESKNLNINTILPKKTEFFLTKEKNLPIQNKGFLNIPNQTKKDFSKNKNSSFDQKNPDSHSKNFFLDQKSQKDFFIDPKNNINSSEISFNSNFFNNSKLDNDLNNEFIRQSSIIIKKNKNCLKIEKFLKNKHLKKQMSNVGREGFNILNFDLKKNYMKKRTDEVNFFTRKNIEVFCEAYRDIPKILEFEKKVQELPVFEKDAPLNSDLARISLNSKSSKSFQTPKSLKSYKLDTMPFLNK